MRPKETTHILGEDMTSDIIGVGPPYLSPVGLAGLPAIIAAAGEEARWLTCLPFRDQSHLHHLRHPQLSKGELG